MSTLISDLEKQPSTNFLSSRRVMVAVFLILLPAAAIIYGLRVSDNQTKAASKRAAAAGLAAYKKGDFGGAVITLKKATKVNPANAEAQRTLGQSYEATGKLDKAAKAYQASLAANPKQTEVLYNLAIIYKSQNKTKEAVQELEKAVALNKQFIAAKLILGDLYLQQGKKDKAKEQYQAVVDMKPFGVSLVEVQSKLDSLRQW